VHQPEIGANFRQPGIAVQDGLVEFCSGAEITATLGFLRACVEVFPGFLRIG